MTGYATYLATYQSGLTVAVAGCSRTGTLVLGLAGPGDDRLLEFALRPGEAWSLQSAIARGMRCAFDMGCPEDVG